MITALTAAQPIAPTSAYWVSSNWVANTRKYMETLTLPDIPTIESRGFKGTSVGSTWSDSSSGSGKMTYTAEFESYSGSSNNAAIKKESRKSSRIRARRGSDALPPWPSINADLVCPHGNMTLLKNPKAKRRLVIPAVWHFLRRFYPAGPTFRAGKHSDINNIEGECTLCETESQTSRQVYAETQRRELQRRVDECIPAELESLAQRRSGVPTHLLRSRAALYTTSSTTPRSTVSSSLDGAVSRSAGESEDNSPHIASNIDAAGVDSDALQSLDDQATELGISIQELCDLQGITISEAIEARNQVILHNHMEQEQQSVLSSHNSEHDNTVDQIEEQYANLPDTFSPDLSPLLPGLYNIVPRTWLKKWRTYTRDSSATHPPADIDCARLLCHSHGLLVVPPHVEEYLCGIRRTLLSGLGGYEGDVVEIVSADEWEILQTVSSGLTDLSVGFALDDDGHVNWSCNICRNCDPFAYNTQRRGREGKKRNPAGSNNSTGINEDSGIYTSFSASPGQDNNDFDDFMSGDNLHSSNSTNSGLIHIGGGVSVLNPSIAFETEYALADPAKHFMGIDVDPRDWERTADVIVDDATEYPSLIGSTHDASDASTSNTVHHGATEEPSATDGLSSNTSPWNKSIPSPVRRATKEKSDR
jgi:hypothetical protein